MKSTDGPGRRHGHADDEQRDHQERAGEWNVQVKRYRHRPDSGRRFTHRVPGEEQTTPFWIIMAVMVAVVIAVAAFFRRRGWL